MFQPTVDTAEDEMGSGLHNAGFLVGDSLLPIAFAVGVVEPNVGHNCDAAVANVGCVEATKHANFDDGHINALLCEPCVRGSGEHLEGH